VDIVLKLIIFTLT